MNRPAASRAEIRVPSKLTASLPKTCLRSRLAPSRLSANIPTTAAVADTHNQRQARRPATRATKLTTIAAMIPATVPPMLMPPSVPAGTRSKVVIRSAVSLVACPYSLETVSAAASANAATQASKKTCLSVMANSATQDVAIPKLASTWNPFRPLLFSAVPRCSFRA